MLSDRVRANSEAAPWVIDEILKLEDLIRRAFHHVDLEPGNAVIALRRDLEAALKPAGPKCICTLEDMSPRDDCPVHNSMRAWVRKVTDPAYVP